MSLKGRVALVTGSGRGIGKAIALKLADMGAKVAINDLPTTNASAAIQEIESCGGETIWAPADVTNTQAVRSMIDQIVEKWEKIDILVNNAGISSDSLILRLSEDRWDSVMNVNLRSAFLCTKYALRSMMGQQWGRIINMASVAGVLGNMGRVDYSASKGGLVAFTRSLAPEVGSRNITVNAIAPGFIDTRMTQDLPSEYKDVILSRTVLKRPGTPQEVAELAGFLASDAASYITGQVICIDGGIS